MKALKWTLIVFVALFAVSFGGYKYLISETKKASPEDEVTYEVDGFQLKVNYCRPYMKGRKIFGGLVPYNEVWRTGANEATTFETNQDINFAGKRLLAGKYSMWTIPQQTQWTIILNNEIPGWGVGLDSKASRNPEHDILKVNVASIDTDGPVEQFTIRFEYNVNMIVEWENTKISIPIQF